MQNRIKLGVCEMQIMYKMSLLLLLELEGYASSYIMEPSGGETPHYFVKMGAYTVLDNAQKELNRLKYPASIIYLKDYYSLVSEEFSDKALANKALREMKKNYHDAYVMTLYTKHRDKQSTPDKVVDAPINDYQQGIAYYQKASYEEALCAFDRAMIENENDTAAHIMYARTLYKLGLYKEARGEFHKLLAEGLPAQTNKHIRYYLSLIEENTKRHFLTATFLLGAGYDDNINLTTDDKETQYGALMLTNDTDKTSSSFGIASLSLAHKYKGNDFDVLSNLYLYNELAHSAKGNDLNYINVSTGVMKRLEKFSFFFPLGANTSFLDGKNVGYNYFTAPSIAYHDRHWHSDVQMTLLDNTSKYLKGKDYRLYGTTLGSSYHDRGFQGGMEMGYQAYRAKESLRFDVDKLLMFAAISSQYFILRDTYVGANMRYQKEQYTKEDSVLGYKRADDSVQAGVSLAQKIGQKSLLSLQYMHRENDSNVNAYSYKKNTMALEYSYQLRK